MIFLCTYLTNACPVPMFCNSISSKFTADHLSIYSKFTADHLILIRTRKYTNTVSKNELIIMSITLTFIYYCIMIFISIQFTCVLKCNKCQDIVEENHLCLPVKSCWGSLILQWPRKSGDVMVNICMNFWWACSIFKFQIKQFVKDGGNDSIWNISTRWWYDFVTI